MPIDKARFGRQHCFDKLQVTSAGHEQRCAHPCVGVAEPETVGRIFGPPKTANINEARRCPQVERNLKTLADM